MRKSKDLWGREPAVILGLAGAVIGLATAFGLPLSGEQQGAISSLLIVLVAVITRSKVSPIDK